MNFRLLSEAEWEFAARGGNLSNDYIYSGSDNIDEVAWCRFNGAQGTHEVATKKANELGIYDMSGNVREWCMDIRNGGNRVIRGGGYNSDPHECRVNYDSRGRDPKFSWDSIGFRLALSDFGLGKSRSSNNSKERSNDTQDTKNKQKESSAKTGMFSFLSKIFKGD